MAPLTEVPQYHETMDDEITMTRTVKDENNNTTTTKKAVDFDTVSVRYYDRILGDNPACHDGLPITFDWDYSHEKQYAVNDYERCYHHNNQQHNKPPVLLSLLEKERHLMMTCGITPQELKNKKREMKSIQRQRRITRTGNLLKDRLWSVMHTTTHHVSSS